MSNIKLILGDCVEKLKEIEEGTTTGVVEGIQQSFTRHLKETHYQVNGGWRVTKSNMKTSKELKEELVQAEKEERRIKHEKWNKEAERWVDSHLGEIYENDLHFPDSNEKTEYWVYKIAGVDKSDSPYKILKHQIYITSRCVKMELNTPIFHSCPYITHGMRSCERLKWDKAVARLLELSA